VILVLVSFHMIDDFYWKEDVKFYTKIFPVPITVTRLLHVQDMHDCKR